MRWCVKKKSCFLDIFNTYWTHSSSSYLLSTSVTVSKGQPPSARPFRVFWSGIRKETVSPCQTVTHTVEIMLKYVKGKCVEGRLILYRIIRKMTVGRGAGTGTWRKMQVPGGIPGMREEQQRGHCGRLSGLRGGEKWAAVTRFLQESWRQMRVAYVIDEKTTKKVFLY